MREKDSSALPGKSDRNFNYFLSCGIPNKVRGERYVKTPEMVQEIFNNTPSLIAPAKYIVFKTLGQN